MPTADQSSGSSSIAFPARAEGEFQKAIREIRGTPTSEDLDAGVLSVKELRRDLDAQLQKLRGMPSSRERSLCITKLQEAILWLGMDLKRMASLRPDPVAPTKTLRQLAQEAYHRYGGVTEFKNFRGDPMPVFDALPEKIIQAWEAAVSADNGKPYPSSPPPRG